MKLPLNNSHNSNQNNSRHLNEEPDYDASSDPFLDKQNPDNHPPFDPFEDLPVYQEETTLNDLTSHWQEALRILLDVIEKENQALFIYQDKSGIEVLENMPVSKATVNHQQLSQVKQVEDLLKAHQPELSLDNEIIVQWSHRLDGATWQKAFYEINHRYPQYYYAFMGYEKLSNYEVDNFESHILAALLQIVSHSGNHLYFEHNIKGEGKISSLNLKADKLNNTNNTNTDRTQYLQINDVTKLSGIMKLYELGLSLHEDIIIHWLDWCIHTLDDNHRPKLYNFIFHNLSWQSVSTEVIRTLARRHLRDTKKLAEIITLIPTCITHMPEIEIARYVTFLQDLTPEQCDNALVVALFAQRNQINESEITQQQDFFHVLKLFASDKLKELNCINLVQHYNRTYELPTLFNSKSNIYREIILDFNTQDIYYFLGLRGSLESEITQWFNEKLINTFKKESAKEYWQIKDATIMRHGEHNYSLSVIVNNQSRLDNDMLERALNEFLIDLRAQNPEMIYFPEHELDKWLDKALLHYVLEKNLGIGHQDKENNATNSTDDTDNPEACHKI
jgi:hypothetical protein